MWLKNGYNNSMGKLGFIALIIILAFILVSFLLGLGWGFGDGFIDQ